MAACLEVLLGVLVLRRFAAADVTARRAHPQADPGLAERLAFGAAGVGGLDVPLLAAMAHATSGGSDCAGSGSQRVAAAASNRMPAMTASEIAGEM